MFARPFRGKNRDIEMIIMKTTKFGRIIVEIHTEDKIKYSYYVKVGLEHNNEFCFVNGREYHGRNLQITMFGTDEKEVEAILKQCELC
jgi:hypothetical protein